MNLVKLSVILIHFLFLLICWRRKTKLNWRKIRKVWRKFDFSTISLGMLNYIYYREHMCFQYLMKLKNVLILSKSIWGDFLSHKIFLLQNDKIGTLQSRSFLEMIASLEVTFSLSDSVTFLQKYLLNTSTAAHLSLNPLSVISQA